MKLGEKIKYIREDKNITQATMADSLDLNRVTITGYEIGRRLPDVYTLKKIADFLGVSMDYLLEEKL